MKLGGDALPRVDAVLISHNHYDHMDAGTVAYLHRRYGAALAWCSPAAPMSLLCPHACGDTPPCSATVYLPRPVHASPLEFVACGVLRRFVPLGLGKWFAGCGIKHAQELDWWQEERLGSAGASVTFTPAQVPGPGHQAAGSVLCAVSCIVLSPTRAQLCCVRGARWDGTA